MGGLVRAIPWLRGVAVVFEPTMLDDALLEHIVVNVLSTLHSLTTLDLSADKSVAVAVPDRAVDSITRHHAHTLTTLNLPLYYQAQNDDSVCALSLRNVQLAGNRVSGRCMHALASSSHATLTTLRLRYTPSISSVALRAVVTACSQLQHLHLDSCDKVCNDTMRAIASSCHHLHSLYVNVYGEDDGNADDGVLALSTGCTRLQRITFHSEPQLTEHSLLPLFRACRSLTHVELDIVTDAAFLALAGTSLHSLTYKTCEVEGSTSRLCVVLRHSR